MSGFTNVTGFAPPTSVAGFMSLLQTASFRGVPFKVIGAQVKKGRRQAVHEYPYVDGGWPEDMGRSLRVYAFSGYLIGDVAPVMQLLLDNAVETKGPGLLIHPTIGAVKVAVLSAGTAIHKDKMRIIEVAFEFIEAGASIFPVLVIATAIAVLAAADSALTAAGTDFGSIATPAAAAGPAVTAEGQAVVTSFCAAATVGGSNPTAIVGMATALPPPDANTSYGRYGAGSASVMLPIGTTVASLQAQLANQRAALALAAAGAVSAAGTYSASTDMIDALAALVEAVRGGITDPADQVQVLLALAGFSFSDSASGSVGVGAAMAAMRDAMAAACRRAVLVSLARASASYQPISYNDAAALRVVLAAALDGEITAAGDAGEDASYLALKALRAAVVQDLTVRGASLPSVVTVTLQLPLPSLTIAQLLYCDASRSDEITAESGAIHPAFCPVTFQALASGTGPTVNPSYTTAPGSSGEVLIAATPNVGAYHLPVPNMPQSLAVVSTTSSTVVLSWSAPSGGGLPADYIVQDSPSGEGAWSTAGTVSAGSTGYAVTGLASNTAFDFQVLASNATGVSSASALVSSTTLMNPPNAPTGLAAAAGSPAYSVVALSWTASAADGTHDAAATYQPQYELASGGSWTNFGSPISGTSVNVTGLARSTAYNFQVIASNAGGSATSSAVGETTLARAPNAPTGLSASAGSPAYSVVALSWTASAVDGTHDAAATYQPQYELASGGTWTNFGSPISGTSVNVTGLAHATAFNLRSIAANTGGTATSSSTGATTTTAAPNAVTSLAVGTVTANTLPLTWTASAVDSSHDAAAAYTVQYRINGSANWITASSSVTGTSYTLAALIAGLTYQSNVFATNAGGNSAGTTVTHATGAAGGSFTYWGTGGYPTSSVSHGSTTTIVAFITNGGSIVSAKFGWSTTQVDPPATLQAMTEFSSTLFGASANTPATAGSYHGWMIFYDSSGDALLAAIAASGQTQQGGAAIMDPLTVT